MDNIRDESGLDYGTRLDRIEGKIDKLSDAVIAIARAEERIVAIEADKHDYWQRLNNHAKKIDEHDVTVTKHAATIEMLERLHSRDKEECHIRQKEQGERIGGVEKAVDTIEHHVADIKRTTTVIHRITWSVAAVFVAYAVNQVMSVV